MVNRLLSFYPGDEYCDVVGLDHYAAGFEFRGYAELTALGKPFGITEIGPKRDLRGSYDYAELIAVIRERYPIVACLANARRATNGSPAPLAFTSELPNISCAGINKTILFQAWAWDWSLSRNKNAAAILADPWVIGRDELPRRDTR